jgi:hypothetical protein
MAAFLLSAAAMILIKWGVANPYAEMARLLGELRAMNTHLPESDASN